LTTEASRLKARLAEQEAELTELLGEKAAAAGAARAHRLEKAQIREDLRAETRAKERAQARRDELAAQILQMEGQPASQSKILGKRTATEANIGSDFLELESCSQSAQPDDSQASKRKYSQPRQNPFKKQMNAHK